MTRWPFALDDGFKVQGAAVAGVSAFQKSDRDGRTRPIAACGSGYIANSLEFF